MYWSEIFVDALRKKERLFIEWNNCMRTEPKKPKPKLKNRNRTEPKKSWTVPALVHS